MTATWPPDWTDRINGDQCPMCESARVDEDAYGLRIHTTGTTDAILQRAAIQTGYTLVIWRGRHVVEPFDLTAAGCPPDLGGSAAPWGRQAIPARRDQVPTASPHAVH